VYYLLILTHSLFEAGGHVTRLVSYLHGDVHSDNDVQCLEQMVSTVINLNKSPVTGKQFCSIIHVRRSGKILHKVVSSRKQIEVSVSVV